jgi:flagellar basal-body rod protein FlgG
LDFAIEGKGFFGVTDPNGGLLYTRSGNFGINASNQLVLGSAQTGWILDPPISIPPEATNVVVTTDGQVQYSTATDTTLTNAGQIQTSTFINPDGFAQIGRQSVQANRRVGGRPREPGKTGPAWFARVLSKRPTSNLCKN